MVGNDLYWVHIDVKKDVMAVPTAGGAPHSVVSGIEAYAPSWSRDGKRIAYVLGEYRLVDWALSQDVGIVDVVDCREEAGHESAHIHPGKSRGFSARLVAERPVDRMAFSSRPE